MATTKVINDVIDLNQTGNTTALKGCVGTTAQQPTGVEGMLRTNTDLSSAGSNSAMQFYKTTGDPVTSGWVTLTGIAPIPPASENFTTALYAGDSSTQQITTGFQPDFIWIKARNAAHNNISFDSVRTMVGNPSYRLSPNQNYAESNWATSAGITATDSTSFSVKDPGVGGYGLNTSGENYVSWSWKAGGTPTASSSGTSQTPTANSKIVDGVSDTSNWATTTNGYPTKQSVNTSTGFSITAFTKASYGNPCTVPHSLGATPEFIISKIYNIAEDWIVWHKDIENDYYLSFNRNGGTDARTSSIYNFTTVDSNIIETQWTNAVQNWIFYAWTGVTGYSKFDKYAGTGSGNSQSITTGFEPGWVMIKDYTAGGSWWIQDSKRGASISLKANSLDAESTTNYVTFTSTGFDVTGGLNDNSVSSQFIYMAFAS